MRLLHIFGAIAIIGALFLYRLNWNLSRNPKNPVSSDSKLAAVNSPPKQPTPSPNPALNESTVVKHKLVCAVYSNEDRSEAIPLEEFHEKYNELTDLQKQRLLEDGNSGLVRFDGIVDRVERGPLPQVARVILRTEYRNIQVVFNMDEILALQLNKNKLIRVIGFVDSVFHASPSTLISMKRVEWQRDPKNAFKIIDTVCMHPSQALSSPAWKRKLRAVMSEKDFAQLRENVTVASRMFFYKGSYCGDGIAVHGGGSEEGIFAGTEEGSGFAAILVDAKLKLFGDVDHFPPCIREWLKMQ